MYNCQWKCVNNAVKPENGLIKTEGVADKNTNTKLRKNAKKNEKSNIMSGDKYGNN